MTRGGHPNSEEPKTYNDQDEDEGDGIVSQLVIKIAAEIGPKRSTKPPSQR